MDPVDEYLTLLAETLGRISRHQVWKVIEVLYLAWKDGRHIFLIGNGGSAATASHMANDLNKFTIIPGKTRFKAVALTDNIPIMTAWANDQSYEDIFTEQLINFLEPGDVVVQYQPVEILRISSRR
jgi:D-sedoheptulose 7-phosphate isomerase